VDAWLVGAFLLVFAGAIAATAPSGSASIQDIEARAGKGPASGATESARGDAVRTAQRSVRALLPDSFGGDLIPVHDASDLVIGRVHLALQPAQQDATSAPARAFQARAPPYLM